MTPVIIIIWSFYVKYVILVKLNPSYNSKNFQIKYLIANQEAMTW